MNRARVAIWAVAALGLVVGSSALAQKPKNKPAPRVGAEGANAEGEGVVDGVFLPPDRTAKRNLERARELLASNPPEFSDAVRYLGTLLEGSEDYFFRPDPSQPVYRSLKAEAGRLMAELPLKGQESYELQFGATARRMLREATGSGDIAKVAEVSRRFFYTQAGWEATVLVARDQLDHGSPLAAALCFERLGATPAAVQRLEPMLSLSLAACWARGGMPEKATEVLVALKKKYPNAPIRPGEKSLAVVAGDGRELAWLGAKAAPRTGPAADAGEWTMFRGDAGRNAASAGGAPLLNARWQRLAFDLRSDQEHIAQMRRTYLDQDVAALPSAHPLAVGNTVLMRRPSGLWGINFATGKLVWEFPDRSFQELIENSPVSLKQTALEQRTWDDSTYGTMSSDGECIYMVDNLASAAGGGQFAMPAMFIAGRHRGVGWPKSANSLVALELGTQGKLRWRVGTDVRGEEGGTDPRLAGTFFLGPPLPLHGRLYVLAETKGQEIRLIVLSARDGHLEWSQQLAVVDQEVLEPYRRTAGTTPSYADGVLVCPTSAGAVVAVDLASRSLLWGYQYPRDPQVGVERIQAMRMGAAVFPGMDQRTNDRWTDATATVVDGRVLVTPVEGENLFCLDLRDGGEAWKQPRGENLYVGCVHQGTVVLVGHKHVSAVKLADGSQAWSPCELPPGSMPSGRGYYSGQHYYLPLSTAEVAKINLADGRIESRARSRHGEVPGNLICFRGEVISQGVEHLETFYQLESLKQQVAETLKTDPDGPKALLQLGQIKLDEGNLQEAVSLFRRAYEHDHSDTSRDLLVESLLDGLRADFAGSRQAAQELEPLIEQKQQRAKYLRLMAAGLQQSGDTLAALEVYKKLLDQEPMPAELDEIGESLMVRRNRWVQGQIAQLRSAAKPEEQRQIDAVVHERLRAILDQAVDKAQVAALRDFLHLFGTQPAGNEAREQLVIRLAGRDTALEREQLLNRLESSDDPDVSRRATARLASLYVEAQRPEFAAMYCRKLLDRWKDQVCLDGKTGKELVDQLDPKSPVRAFLAGKKPWPLNPAGASEADSPLPLTPRQRIVEVDIQGSRGPFFGDVNLAIDGPLRMIIARDGQGKERFRFPLAMKNGQVNSFNPPNAMAGALYSVSAHGNLLLVSLGFQLLAIDTLPAADPSKGIIWSQDLVDPIRARSLHGRPVNMPWGAARATDNGRPAGTLTPVNSSGVYFLRLRELVCVDPLRGDTLWLRKNISAGSDVFGDAEMLFVVPPDGSPALVLSAVSGELLGKRAVPPPERQLAIIGRLLLSFKAENDGQVLTLEDPWQEATARKIWSRKFAAGSQAYAVSQEAVAVLEPGGAFVLLNLPDGKPLVQEALEPENALKGIYLLRSDEQYLLVTNTMPEQQTVAPAPTGGPNNPLINGRLYAFDRATGKKMWPQPVAIQQNGLVLNQPSDLPVLVFMGHSTLGGQQGTKAKVLCLDKRTGQTLFRDDAMRLSINNFEFVSDFEKGTVSLILPGKMIVMRFTDKPLSWIDSIRNKLGAAVKNGAVEIATAPAPQAPSGSGADQESPADDEAAIEESTVPIDATPPLNSSE